MPLLVRVPGRAPGVIDSLMSLLDVIPTVMAMVLELTNRRFLAQRRIAATAVAPRNCPRCEPMAKPNE